LSFTETKNIFFSHKTLKADWLILSSFKDRYIGRLDWDPNPGEPNIANKNRKSQKFHVLKIEVLDGLFSGPKASPVA
jgi:hypothetical protein